MLYKEYQQDNPHLSDIQLGLHIAKDLISQYPYLDNGKRPLKYSANCKYPILRLCQSLEGVKRWIGSKKVEAYIHQDDPDFFPNVMIRLPNGSTLEFGDYICKLRFDKSWSEALGKAGVPKTELQRNCWNVINKIAIRYL